MEKMRVDQRIGEARGLLAEALALQESGVLISGMTVTDLATGFVVTGDAEMQRPGYLQYEGPDGGAGDTGPVDPMEAAGETLDVEFQRSGLSLGRLSELFEMVSEVLEQREDHPEAAAVNPPEPRELFPWGIGLRDVDVLVTGSFAVQVVHYLRIMGVRARLVDNDMVLRVASELALAQQELEHLDLAEPARQRETDSAAAQPAEKAEEWQEVEERASIEKEKRKDNRRLPAALAALALFIIGGLVATFTVFDSQAAKNPASAGSTGIADSAASVTESRSVESEESLADEPGSEKTGEEATEPFPEPHRRGVTTADQSSRRADIPISVNVDGWHLGGATRAREEYIGDDEGMRVLVAAKETPLKTQEEMDAAMLGALNDVSAGDSEVTVVSTQPVSYEENYPSSTTLWHVRLVDGHQISVGCQYRQWNEQREKVCQEFVETARPEKQGKP